MPKIELSSAFEGIVSTADKINIEISNTASLYDVLNKLAIAYPALKQYLFDANNQLLASMLFYHNDCNIKNCYAKTAHIKNKDRITILPAIAGG